MEKWLGVTVGLRHSFKDERSRRFHGDALRGQSAVLRVARVLAVAFGMDTIEAEVDSGRVWRIVLSQPRFRTIDSLGVGTSIARLLALPGVHGVIGEGALYLASPVHCGVSFRVTDPVDDSPASDWTLPMLKRLPAATVVTAVLISGCLGAG